MSTQTKRREAAPNSSAKASRRKALSLPPEPSSDIEWIPIDQAFPSPENEQLYRPVTPDDPEIARLADSIREIGIQEPLVLDQDGWVVSGHRRLCAAKLAGKTTIPVRRQTFRRTDDLSAFVQRLREHNRQREKTNAEKLREELVSVNPYDAHQELWRYRREKASVGVTALKLGHVPVRCAISAAKLLFLAAVIAIIEARRDYWPLSDRQIHYALLNDPPLIHAGKPKSVYRNDLASYKRLVDLLTRGRLEGRIPSEAIGDETRPVDLWQTHASVRSFIRREIKGMFRGYWRDLMQSQANHIELIGEKNTVAPILRSVASEYTIPLTTGRGYCSLPPRQAMAERYRKSGKEKLVLLLVSDFDPDGEEIAHSFARSLRDDFQIADIHPIKVALTAEQVKRYKLPPIMQAKKSSSRYKGFVKKHGKSVFELEALPPETLQLIVRESIEAVIDRDAYSTEIEAESADAAFLQGVRRTVHETLRDLDLDELGEEEPS